LAQISDNFLQIEVTALRHRKKVQHHRC